MSNVEYTSHWRERNIEGRQRGREGEELRMLNISDTLDLLVISLMRSGVYVSE